MSSPLRFDSPLPECRDAERAVVGACIYKPSIAVPLVRDKIGPEHFLDRDCRVLYEHILAMIDAGETVDTLTLRLRIREQVDGSAGDAIADAIHGLSAEIGGDFANVGYYADLMLKTHARREAIQVATELANAARDGDIGFPEAIESTRHRLAGIDATAGRKTGVAMRRMADIESVELTWLWGNRIPRNKLSIIAGVPGQGKSYVSLDIAARVSTGTPFVDEDQAIRRQPENVILISGEDSPEDVVRPRLEKLGADLSRIYFVDGILRPDGEVDWIDLGQHLHHIEIAVTQTEARLIVIDPIMCFMGQQDTNKDNLTRIVLGMLGSLAARLGVTIIVVSHLNKAAGMNALHRVIGSQSFVAAARSGWLIGPNPERPEHQAFVAMKSNLGEKMPGLAFTIDPDGVVRWFDYEVASAANDVATYNPSSKAGGTSAIDDASKFLRDILGEGPRLMAHVIGEAEHVGIKETTLRRAFKRLGGKSQKSSFGGGWLWPISKVLIKNNDHLRVFRPKTGVGDEDDHLGIDGKAALNVEGGRTAHTSDDEDGQAREDDHLGDFGPETAIADDQLGKSSPIGKVESRSKNGVSSLSAEDGQRALYVHHDEDGQGCQADEGSPWVDA